MLRLKDSKHNSSTGSAASFQGQLSVEGEDWAVTGGEQEVQFLLVQEPLPLIIKLIQSERTTESDPVVSKKRDPMVNTCRSPGAVNDR